MILTLKEYKDYKNIASTNQDTELLKVIPAVNQTITSYCNRTFVDYYASDKTEYFDATLEDYFPKEFPIVSVTSIKYSSNNDGVYDTDLNQYTDWVIDDEYSRIVAVNNYFVSSPVPFNSGQLIYKGGYEHLPEDITLAAVHLAEYYLEEGYTPRKSLAGASVDNVIIPDKTARMPAHVRRILEHYRACEL